MRTQLKKKDQTIDELGAKVQRKDQMLDRMTIEMINMAVEMKNKGERLDKMEAEMAEIKALLAGRGWLWEHSSAFCRLVCGSFMDGGTLRAWRTGWESPWLVSSFRKARAGVWFVCRYLGNVE